ncbi:MAG TPA: S8 family serine peptidase [Burkholderiaceae bacterium]|nr:S8 family serine peptidase [Burkholderiaceae bacterium]
MGVVGYRRMRHALAAAVGAAFCVAAGAGSLSPELAQQFGRQKDADVIVILRDQLPGVQASHGAHSARHAALAAAQAPVVDVMQRGKAQKVRGFGTFNAIAANVTKDVAAQLAAHPAVQAVVLDKPIKAAPKRASLLGGVAADAAGAVSAAGAATSSGANASPDLCNTLEPEALQLMNAAYASTSVPQAQQVLDGAGRPVTGRGVKVAFIADGLDPTIPGFTRPDGSSVFFDYQVFNGDPAGTATAGAEAFGDASSIAAQDMPNGTPLTFDISKFVNASHPLPSPCNIRIRGVAPGASLAGLNVFSNLGYTTTSMFVQAIEYAVEQDDVDVINQSFGGTPYPDTENDPISLADAAAVRAGVTVVASTGDAGTAGTLGSPATDPWVISAGASTQFRFYRQTAYGALGITGGGTLSDNISSLSSGGFAIWTPRTVDVVAPGDLGWALCSTNVTLYNDCTDFNGKPSGIESFGGTSEAAPLTSAVAALVIQAYRSTHGGASPSPALVKSIIMSTATDLGAPAFEQGAGLVNALKAVNVALSIRDSNGSPRGHGDGVVASPSASEATDYPGTRLTRSFKVTNTGTSTAHLTPTLQVLGAALAGQTITVPLNPATDPTFVNTTGATRTYTKRTFVVPPGADHLDGTIAFQSPLGTAPLVYFSLVDPSGKQATYSIPQGAGSGYAHTDVVHPMAGTWTALIWTRPVGVAGSYTGPVQFTWSAERFSTYGSVSPSSLDLAAGASATLSASFAMPSTPGDVAAEVRFGNSGSSSSPNFPAIPVTLRSLVPVGPTGAAFGGTLTGGNGRPGAGPVQTFEFDVPAGLKDLGLSVAISDPGYLLEGELVDPQGMTLSLQPNIDAASGSTTGNLQMTRVRPQPGRWHFVFLQDFTSSGNQTSLPFSAKIAFNSVQVGAAALPSSTSVSLHAGKPVVVPVMVTNSTAVTQLIFADARLDAYGPVALPLAGENTNGTLLGSGYDYFVPPQANEVQFVAQASEPINMDAVFESGYGVGFAGSPDIFACNVNADTVVATLQAPEIPYGLWAAFPSVVGPFGSAGATDGSVSTAAIVNLKTFDASVTADSGNLWADLVLGTSTFKPLVLAPGQTGTVNVTITPSAAPGTVVTGTLSIDNFNGTVYTGDEIARLPYRYTVVP